jgi:hypothetical protein
VLVEPENQTRTRTKLILHVRGGAKYARQLGAHARFARVLPTRKGLLRARLFIGAQKACAPMAERFTIEMLAISMRMDSGCANANVNR